MKVFELLPQEIDIDVYSGVVDDGIAFCGPMGLTELGKNEFEDVLNVELKNAFEYVGDRVYPSLIIDTEDVKEDRRTLDFFKCMAGYCAADDWDVWFYFPEDSEK